MFSGQPKYLLPSFQGSRHPSGIASILSKRQSTLEWLSRHEHTGTVYKILGLGFSEGQFSKIDLNEDALIPWASVSISVISSGERRIKFIHQQKKRDAQVRQIGLTNHITPQIGEYWYHAARRTFVVNRTTICGI